MTQPRLNVFSPPTPAANVQVNSSTVRLQIEAGAPANAGIVHKEDRSLGDTDRLKRSPVDEDVDNSSKLRSERGDTYDGDAMPIVSNAPKEDAEFSCRRSSNRSMMPRHVDDPRTGKRVRESLFSSRHVSPTDDSQQIDEQSLRFFKHVDRISREKASLKAEVTELKEVISNLRQHAEKNNADVRATRSKAAQVVFSAQQTMRRFVTDRTGLLI